VSQQTSGIIGHIAKWLFVLCLPIFLLSATIALTADSLWFYNYGMQKYDVKATLAAAGLPMSDAEISHIHAQFIRYYNNGQKYINIIVPKGSGSVRLLTDEETQHFKDVKGLIRFDYTLAGGTGVFLLGYAATALFWQRGRHRRKLAQALLWGGGLTLVVMLVLGLVAVINFNWFWLQFHLISFSNLYWSAEGYMLLLFPGGMFDDMVRFISGVVILLAIMLGVVGWWYLRRTRRALAEGKDE
jgi:integral membrane protein (TIGR01906 family)